MTCICIGGICIPYTALFPMLVIGFRWIACQFERIGILPQFVARRLGLRTANTNKTMTEARGTVDGRRCGGGGGGGGGRGCCDDAGGGKNEGVGGVASSSSSSFAADVEHVDDLARWEALSSSCETNESSVLFVKFTADWCKPCKSIHPAYASLASSRRENGKSRIFVALDVDGDGCDVVSGKYGIGMLPTFVCLVGGKEVGRMSGGHDEDGLVDWVDEMLRL
ncbi:hypothetical protein ACHAXA_003526 [Cyclostephanos tholiformis]|uniref:Thioredoxin domain-containing protein n=1 Tax=Cyclostephanos tholiformis TaxID=382380 RepID=A0ABD3R3Y6_9STRA